MIMTRISPAAEPDHEALVIQAQQVIAQHRHSKAGLEQTTILFYRSNFARLLRQNEEMLNAVDKQILTPEQADLVQRPAAKATHYINRRSYSFGLCETIEELLAAPAVLNWADGRDCMVFRGQWAEVWRRPALPEGPVTT